MASIDIFNDGAFSMSSLTAAINSMPHVLLISVQNFPGFRGKQRPIVATPVM
jgi:hypothetical protein